LTLIRELCSGSMLTQGSDGKPVGYEEVLRPQFNAMVSNRTKSGKGTTAPAEVFLESEDWQTLL